MLPLGWGAHGASDGSVGLVGAEDPLHIVASLSKWDVLDELIGGDVAKARDPLAHISFARIVGSDREEGVVVEVPKQVVEIPAPNGQVRLGFLKLCGRNPKAQPLCNPMAGGWHQLG